MIKVFIVMIKDHHGFHQVQRGGLLAIGCNMLPLMATYLIDEIVLDGNLLDEFPFDKQPMR